MIARAIEVHDNTWWRWVVAGWAVVLLFAWGPAVERTVFPVVSKLEILSINPSGGGSEIYVRFEKRRVCEYLGMNWERIDDEGVRRRVFLNLKPTPDSNGSTRPVGEFVAGPWYVGLPPSELQDHSVATLTHRCHPLWILEKTVWP